MDRNPPLGSPEDVCAEAEAYVAQLHRDHPDGAAVMSPDLPGYCAPLPPGPAGSADDGRRDALGFTLDDWQRAIAQGRRPGR
jgi:hypothetical protein